jgi:hypothetical protein
MAFILAPERDDDPEGAFASYRAYLSREKHRFPAGAFALAASDWYLGGADHRAPHDAWLLSASFDESGVGERNEDRSVSLCLRLLGAYHDLELEFRYPRVFAYTVRGEVGNNGHGDWRYDEFRLTPQGHLLHEIQWWGPEQTASWLIEADDVVFTSRRVGQRT